ncbi:MAG: penicillin-binding protein activator [Methylomicrobium sp.]
MSRHYCLHSLLICASLSACTTSQTQPSGFPPEAHQAQAYMNQGQPAKAAQVYRRIADEQSEFQDQLRLYTIESLIQAGNSGNAKSYADAIDASKLNPLQQNQLHLYYAQIHLSFGEAEQAIGRIEPIKPQQLSRSDQIKYYQSKAFAYSLTGELQKSAAARVELGDLLILSQQHENNAAILETLSLLPPAELEQEAAHTAGTLGGWMKLAHLLQSYRHNRTALDEALVQWRLTYPNHPADTDFLNDYLSQTALASAQPRKIAIFLPETGAFARAGKAIREGMMAAYHQDHNETRPELRFYDSEQNSLAALYQQALSEGAEMIIGPLSKPEIENLAASTDLGIPVLALNHVPEIVKPNLYQFGLSPIDDAEQIAAKAWLDGRRNTLILIPDSEQGYRIGDYLRDFWGRAEGNVLEVQTYRSNQTDFSEPIKKLLNLDESEQRFQKIRQFLPSAAFVPRIRQDADVLLLNAYETAARSINPQLSYFRAQQLPVYATPHVYSGLPNPQSDLDLNRMTFCDIPWLFDTVYQGELSLQALKNTWQQFPTIYLRLMAMGIDAYQLVPHLAELNTTPFQGATGNLSLMTDGRIKRQLVCAQFKQGIPEVLGFVNFSEDDFESPAFPTDSEDEPY